MIWRSRKLQFLLATGPKNILNLTKYERPKKYGRTKFFGPSLNTLIFVEGKEQFTNS